MSSASASPGRAFYLAFALLAAVLLTGILVLAVLVSTSGPRVRHVVVRDREGYGGVGVVGQGLTVFFDRPIETSDPGAAVEIRPETDHTVAQRGQQIDVSFDQNLRSNTEYVLTIGPGLTDAAGRRMERAYTYEFGTEKPVFTYLKRDYGPGTPDRVVERSPLSGESRTLFEADRITRFARNDEYLAVVLSQPEVGDELRVVPLGVGEDKAVNVPPGARVEDVQFSPTEDQLVFVARAESQPGSGSHQKSGELYRYDVGDGRLRTVPGGEGVESVLYSRDGQVLLYRTAGETYYLTDATRATKPSPLGDYEASGGFDRTNTRISFETRSGEAAIYDSRQRQVLELPLVGAGMVTSTPTFLHNSDALIYRQDFVDRRADVTLSEIDVAYQDGKVEKQITARYPTAFFDKPVVSYDDRYVLVESTLDPSELDDYTGNEQPIDAYLSLYDRFDNAIVEVVRGIDPVWSP